VNLPLKWHGGKGAYNGKLARWIISNMPPHRTYVEPYFGGGAVLLHKDPEGTSEVVNDLNGDLMNFWAVLAKTPDRMLRQLWATPLSEPAFDAAFQDLADQDDVRRATAFFIRVRQSRQGLMKDFATLSKGRTRGDMNEQASAWWSAVEGLPEVHDRLKRVVIFSRDALEVIRKTDSPDTLFYLDPPYMHETRSDKKSYGKFEMSVGDHAALLSVLLNVRGKFLLSGYDSELYRQASVAGGWRWRKFDIANNASSAEQKEIKTEFLWSNF
jgi:DNA adenine methylase